MSAVQVPYRGRVGCCYIAQGPGIGTGDMRCQVASEFLADVPRCVVQWLDPQCKSVSIFDARVIDERFAPCDIPRVDLPVNR